MTVGDVCLLKGSAKYSAPAYRLCRVVSQEEDSHGVVRTVEIEIRGKFASDRSTEYNGRKVKRMVVGVQRLAVILPVEEQGRSVTQEEDEVAAVDNEIVNSVQEHTCSVCNCE